MQKLYKIKFVLKNCEVIEVSGAYLMKLAMENIRENLCINSSGRFNKHRIADSIVIALKHDGDFDNPNFGKVTLESTVYERLSIGDIFSIDITLIDEETLCLENIDTIYVDYDSYDGNDSKNINQKTLTNPFGDLFIVIDREKTLEECFDIENINDKSYLEYFFYNSYRSE